jgi:hypothetical protein
LVTRRRYYVVQAPSGPERPTGCRPHPRPLVTRMAMSSRPSEARVRPPPSRSFAARRGRRCRHPSRDSRGSWPTAACAPRLPRHALGRREVRRPGRPSATPRTSPTRSRGLMASEWTRRVADHQDLRLRHETIRILHGEAVTTPGVSDACASAITRRLRNVFSVRGAHVVRAPSPRSLGVRGRRSCRSRSCRRGR